MIDRGSTFADKGVVELLRSRFVPVAIDQAYQRRQKDNEGEFYRKIARQGPRHDFQATTQGLYVADASGAFLGFSNHRDPKRILRLLKRALADFEPRSDITAIAPGKLDARFHPRPPRGGLVVRVRAKVLGGYEPSTNRWRRIQQLAVSRDNLWITADEQAALVAGRFPKRLARRIARFHLVDNTRGEPPMWKDDEIRALDLRLDKGRITGTVHLETKNGARGYQAALFGTIGYKAGRVTELSLAARGKFWGEGRYTPHAPKGRFPLAVVFELADGQDVADAIPPQGARGWVAGYLR